MSSPPRTDPSASSPRPKVTLMNLAEKRALGEPIVMVTAYDHPSALARAGVPLMGHVGITPQTATALGGYRAQGRTAERAKAVLDDALALQEAGCFSIVFEAIPAEVTDVIMEHMEVPIIGIGAGASTDGQVLVLHDLLAIHQGFQPKFVKEYAAIGEAMVEGVRQYAEEVRNRE